ncbi:uncharacterized protein [Parasteatoda tepidariorum]|uniref:uncharacterized protein n=1 Tax=Parasteatoda tepidariorum TaxID=114398 RepID=UPI0039BC699D
MCDIKDLTVSIYKLDDVMNLTTFSNGRYELNGVEGKFLQLLLDFLGVNAKFKQLFEVDLDRFHAPNEIVDAGEADISTTYMMSYDSFDKGFLSAPYKLNYYTFAVRNSVPISTRFAFLQPFAFDAWMGFLAVFIILPIFAIKIMNNKLSYLDLLFHMCGCVLKQPLQFSFETLKGRLLFLFWLLFTMIISFCYSAVFFSFMVNPLKKPPVRNFEELSDAVSAGTHKCYMLPIKARINSLKHSENAYVRRLIKQMEDKSYFFDYRKNSDFHEDLVEGDAILRPEALLRLKFGMNPNLFISDDIVLFTLTSFYFPKDFCLKNRINIFISRAWNSGVYDKFIKDAQRKYILAAMKKSYFTKNTVNPLHLQDIFGVLILLFSGYILSILVLVVEKILYKCTKQ